MTRKDTLTVVRRGTVLYFSESLNRNVRKDVSEKLTKSNEMSQEDRMNERHILVMFIEKKATENRSCIILCLQAS